MALSRFRVFEFRAIPPVSMILSAGQTGDPINSDQNLPSRGLEGLYHLGAYHLGPPLRRRLHYPKTGPVVL
jgi:hypothetical protein